MRRSLSVLALIGAVLVASAGSATAEPADPGSGRTSLPPVYLALGDSTSFGIGADAPELGFVGQLADLLREDLRCGPVWRPRLDDQRGRRPRCPQLELVNLSVSGANSAELIDAQLPAALALLETRNTNRSRFDDVLVITVTIGGNDLLEPAVSGPIIGACAPVLPDPTPAERAACGAAIEAGLTSFEANLDLILGELRDAAGRRTAIVATGYANPLYGCPPDAPLAPLTAVGDVAFEGFAATADSPEYRGLNDVVEAVADEHDVDVANAFGQLDNDEDFADCLHPDQSGHTEYAEIFAEELGLGGRGR